ncbi:hypothetical protein JOM56_015574 [Amanita muscaria]
MAREKESDTKLDEVLAQVVSNLDNAVVHLTLPANQVYLPLPPPGADSRARTEIVEKNRSATVTNAGFGGFLELRPEKPRLSTIYNITIAVTVKLSLGVDVKLAHFVGLALEVHVRLRRDINNRYKSKTSSTSKLRPVLDGLRSRNIDVWGPGQAHQAQANESLRCKLDTFDMLDSGERGENVTSALWPYEIIKVVPSGFTIGGISMSRRLSVLKTSPRPETIWGSYLGRFMRIKLTYKMIRDKKNGRLSWIY